MDGSAKTCPPQLERWAPPYIGSWILGPTLSGSAKTCPPSGAVGTTIYWTQDPIVLQIDFFIFTLIYWSHDQHLDHARPALGLCVCPSVCLSICLSVCLSVLTLHDSFWHLQITSPFVMAGFAPTYGCDVQTASPSSATGFLGCLPRPVVVAPRWVGG